MRHKKTKTISLLVAISLAAFVKIALAESVEIAPPEGQNPVYEQNYEEKNKNIDEALPIYSFPISKFDFAFAFKDEKINYMAGETLEAEGVLNYVSNQKDEVTKIMRQCQEIVEPQKKACKDRQCEEMAVKTCNYRGYSLPFIEDAGIFGQIWRTDEEEGYLKGNHLIDEFYVARNLSLKENKEQEFSVSWKIPKELPNGSYYLALSANGSDRFNLMGFPFNPSSKAIAYHFKIESPSQGIAIDKNNLALNGKPYNYLEPVPVISEDEAKIDLSIANLNLKDEKVKIKYEISKWSQEDPKDTIASKEEYVDVPANSKKDFHVSAPVAGLCSTCNIKITASTENSVSKSNIRFSRGTEGMGIFRFIGIAKTEEGNLAPVFCPRSAHWDKATSEGELKVTLLNKQDEPIYTWSGNGSLAVNTACYIINDPKANLDNISYVKVRGEIYNDKKQLEDQKEIVYELPQNKKEIIQAESVPEEGDSGVKLIIVLVALLLILIGVAIVMAKKNKEKKNGNILPM